MSFFISSVMAETGVSSHGSQISLVIMLISFSLIFYYLLFRPQQKRTKEHKKLMDSLTKGDEILTNGGIIGRVIKVSESGYITIALNETIEIMIKREFIAAVLPKGTMKSL